MIEICNGSTIVRIDPEHGGRIAQVEVSGRPLLLGPETGADPLAWGAYPMVPWPGRIRDGRFTVGDREYRMPANERGHAMHGFGFTAPWRVAAATTESATITLALDHIGDWPFGGLVTQAFHAEPSGVSCQITIEAGDRPMPAEFGWHPWFLPPQSLDFEPSLMFVRDDDGIVTGELVAPPPPPWDDCFINHRPVRLVYPEHSVTVSSDCDHWVVFNELSRGTCVEPQSAPPDSFNQSLRLLEREEQRRGSMLIVVDG